jgi:hypothetical protein
MSGSIRIASFDSGDHEFQQLLIRTLKLPVADVQLSNPEYWNGEQSDARRAPLDVNPSEREDNG